MSRLLLSHLTACFATSVVDIVTDEPVLNQDHLEIDLGSPATRCGFQYLPTYVQEAYGTFFVANTGLTISTTDLPEGAIARLSRPGGHLRPLTRTFGTVQFTNGDEYIYDIESACTAFIDSPGDRFYIIPETRTVAYSRPDRNMRVWTGDDRKSSTMTPEEFSRLLIHRDPDVYLSNYDDTIIYASGISGSSASSSSAFAAADAEAAHPRPDVEDEPGSKRPRNLVGGNRNILNASVSAVAGRRSTLNVVTMIMANPIYLEHIQSYLLTPALFISSIKNLLMPRLELEGVFPDIQMFALLPSCESAIEFFWMNSHAEIDREKIENIYFRRDEAALDQAAVRFLALRSEVDVAFNGRTLFGSRLGPGVFDRCFKAVGLLALAGLNFVDLRGTQVVDLTPLATLVRLKELDLKDTAVVDLTPLASLVNLRKLNLSGTQVENLAPLKSLFELRELSLRGTLVVDLSPLACLYNLRLLSLVGTLADRAPLNSAGNRLKITG